MTEPTTTLTALAASERTETDAVAEVARLAVKPQSLDTLTTYAVPTATGVQVIDLDTDEHRRREGANPRRKTGNVALTEHASFATYVNDHGVTGASSLWADRDQGRIVAVINDHGTHALDDEPDWRDHRATLTLRLTPAWKAWASASGQFVDQAAFAEFLEDRALDVVDPDAARLLEVATSIEATKSAAHKNAVRLESGEVRVRYEETIDARAGQAGELTIPSRIELALSPYEGMDPYRVTARFRYRLGNGQLRLGVVLDRPEDVVRAAFGDVVDAVSEATGFTVLHGSAG
jgi:uncharacterized protein YfdQ (DUF2303 family)